MTSGAFEDKYVMKREQVRLRCARREVWEVRGGERTAMGGACRELLRYHSPGDRACRARPVCSPYLCFMPPQIGEGATAAVFRGTRKGDNLEVAIKHIDKSRFSKVRAAPGWCCC